MQDIGFTEELPENQNTLKGNAQEKAQFVFEKTGLNCFADDSGLEVESLGGAPGVYSARYAGEECDSEKNIDKLLSELKNSEERDAIFRTVICLILDKKEFFFEGTIDGIILNERHGTGGFGYDSVFLPDESVDTFAEMSEDEKSSMSHRARAVRKMLQFLRST